MRRASLAVCVMLVFAACDETTVREGASQFATLEESAMRVLVTPKGLGQLVEVANPEGLPLDAAHQKLETDVEVSVGPLAQVLPVTNRMSTPEDASVTLTTRHDDATVFVPMRLTVLGDTCICRWRFEADRIETTAVLALVSEEDGSRFGVIGTPEVTMDSPRIAAITRCDETGELLPEDIDEQLFAYVGEALAQSAANSLPTAPLDTLGLLRTNLQLTRRTPFENRGGTMVLEGAESTRPGSLSITTDGLYTVVDATADAQRAPCAPPLPLASPGTGGADPIDPAVADRFNADFGLALSANFISRVAQSATLAGYSCRGLEDARPEVANESDLPIDEVLLEELGITGVPTSATASIGMSPGSLPAFELRPSNGTIRVSLRQIQLDVYTQIFGARTLVASVIADVVLGLRPRAGAVGAARFDVESVAISNTEVTSEFVSVAAPAADVERWTQRALLVLLEDSLEFPLPLQPAAPVRVVGIQVRQADLVTFLRFE